MSVLLIFAVLAVLAVWRYRHGKRTGNPVRLGRGSWLKVLVANGLLWPLIWLNPQGPWRLLAFGLLLGLAALDQRRIRGHRGPEL
ncbi:MAG: hypothetical protein F4129_09375 [Acidimicrobiia bacterium]|nr:hypothetical protein [Acidimicrobiia bacterium]MYL09168.1 hypothetical protein [Acidimicrobiia bacterium]